MTLRILFTLAILVGLAAAPGAEPFRWEAGHGHGSDLAEHIADRVEYLVERFAHTAERIANRLSQRVERSADRMASRLEQSADRIRERVESRIERRVSTRTARVEASRVRWLEQGAIGDDPCRENDRRDDDYYRHCEVREQRLPAGPLTVDAGQNGGIRVEGWDGSDILVRAIVQASARQEADAKQLASGVEVQAGGGRVSATGPDRSSRGNREWWSVSYRISVPKRTDLDLNASNGGITIADVAGTIRFDTNNGGVRLEDVGGAVNGRTRNGGVRIMLGGTQWDGEGLDVETSNGGVTLAIPEPYNAQLETRTVNGGFRFDYPLTLTGELSPRRGISTAIGAGGAPVRVRTTNGGLRIERRQSSAR
jgi:Putative adhesin